MTLTLPQCLAAALTWFFEVTELHFPVGELVFFGQEVWMWMTLRIILLSDSGAFVTAAKANFLIVLEQSETTLLFTTMVRR